MRITGEIIEKPNPFFGSITISASSTSASVAHNLQGVPGTGFYGAYPTSNPQQLWWVTVSSTNITVTLASAAVTNPVTFNVYAQMTWA